MNAIVTEEVTYIDSLQANIFLIINKGEEKEHCYYPWKGNIGFNLSIKEY